MEKCTHPTLFVDIEIFYKSAHYCQNQVCRAWN